MSKSGQRMTGHWLALVLMLITAAFLIRAARMGDPGLHVPPSIAYVIALAFLLVAVALLQQIIGCPTRGHGAAVLILACFTIVGGWIALSPESGGCTIGVNGGAGSAASGLACRIPFGVGALITGAMTVYSGIAWVQSRRNRDRKQTG